MSSDRQTAPAPDSGRLLIDVGTAAKMCGISRRTLWSLTDSGAVPCRKVGRRVLYVPSELQRWVDRGCPSEARPLEA
jgi:predicted DNA-binding transcriptional regulator AlpA